MPKVTLPKFAEKDIQLARNIESGMKKVGTDYKDVIKKAGICASTHYKRINDPGGMRLKELRVYIKVCNLSKEDVIQALFD